MPTVARVTRPAELAAALPELLGFVPVESIVVLSLHEPRGRLGLTMRIDLDDADVEREVTSRLLRDGATRAALMVVTEKPSCGAELPRRAVVEDLVAAVDAAGVVVVEALLVRDGRCWSYLCRGSCCPPEGTPVLADTGPATLLAAERVLAGDVLRSSREALARSLDPVLPLGVGVRRAELDAAALELLAALVQHPEDAEQRAVRRLDQAVADPSALSSEEAVRCAVALQLRAVREVVLSWAAGRPSEVRRLAAALCRSVPDPEAAPVLLVLGAAAYAEGNGALARLALERAREADPESLMTQLLLTALDGQLPPVEVRAVLAGNPAPLPRPADARRRLRRGGERGGRPGGGRGTAPGEWPTRSA